MNERNVGRAQPATTAGATLITGLILYRNYRDIFAHSDRSPFATRWYRSLPAFFISEAIFSRDRVRNNDRCGTALALAQ